jgi:hypothetical protein
VTRFVVDASAVLHPVWRRSPRRRVGTIPGVTTFTVILEARLTLIDADTCDQAEAKAASAWRDVDPSFTYQPLLTVEQTTG